MPCRTETRPEVGRHDPVVIGESLGPFVGGGCYLYHRRIVDEHVNGPGPTRRSFNHPFHVVGLTDIVTVAPASASARANDVPRPKAPPVTIAVLPALSDMRNASLSVLPCEHKRVNDIGYLHRCTFFQLDDAGYKARSH